MTTRNSSKTFTVSIDHRDDPSRYYFAPSLRSAQLAYLPLQPISFLRNVAKLARSLEIKDSLRVYHASVTVNIDVRATKTENWCPVCGKENEHPTASSCGSEACAKVLAEKEAQR